MKIKIWISLIITLIIGILLGFVISRGIFINRFERSLKGATPQGFVNRFYRIIRPTDNQRSKIDPVLNKYGQRIDDLTFDYKGDIKETMDSFEKEVKPLLTPAQYERIIMEKYKRGRRRKHLNKYFKRGRGSGHKHHSRSDQGKCTNRNNRDRCADF
ncbi:MAG: hypothetical protein ACEPOV_03290 [Hyphomicrobiales bacterium]